MILNSQYVLLVARRLHCCCNVTCSGVPRRFEMGMLQERHDLTERDLATYRQDVGTLRAERDHLANQVCAWQAAGVLVC